MLTTTSTIQTQTRPIRVLIVDDSAVTRQLLAHRLNSDPKIKVVGTAADAFAARDKIVRLEPDVLTLDIQMPRMDGLSFLRQLMKHRPMPVIIVSSLTVESAEIAVEAMASGAVDVLGKPGGDVSVDELADELIAKIKAAHCPAPIPDSEPAAPVSPRLDHKLERNIFALGASTGGVAALHTILTAFPLNAPATLVVQHMPAHFMDSFARRLGACCRVRVKIAQGGDRPEAGTVFIAPGDHHMLLRQREGENLIELRRGPRVQHQRPSVDVLFESIADCAGPQTVAALLTGMGADGATGLLRLRRSGAHTVAQDEASSAVFGMPREAIASDAAERITPLDQIARVMFQLAEVKR